MKRKQWLREVKNISYAEYKELSEYERFNLDEEHRLFCRSKQIHDSQGWRSMTEDEKIKLETTIEKSRERYEISMKIGGIDERGNYTALHHRWE